MTALRSWGGPVLALVAVGLDAGMWPNPRVSMVFALAAVVGMGGWTSLVLGALALATVVVPTAPVVGDAAGWTGLVLSGVGVGLLARSAEPGVAALFTEGRRIGTAVWCSLLGALVTLIPDGYVVLFDGSGDLLSLSVVVEDAVTGVRGIQDFPAYLASPHPGSWAMNWALALGLLTGFSLLIYTVSSAPLSLRLGLLGSRVTGGLLVVSALLGLGGLVGGSMALPSAATLGETLSELAGGRAAISVISAPDSGLLTLASRPLVDWLRLGLGIVLLLWPSWGPATASAQVRDLCPLWLSLGVSCGIAACFVLSPAPSSWAIAGAVVCAVAALVHGRLVGTDERWVDDLQLLSISLWMVALLTPASGWVARL